MTWEDDGQHELVAALQSLPPNERAQALHKLERFLMAALEHGLVELDDLLARMRVVRQAVTEVTEATEDDDSTSA